MRDVTAEIEQARALLASPPARAESSLRALAAAGFAACAALLMAGTVVLGPGFEVDNPMTASAAR